MSCVVFLLEDAVLALVFLDGLLGTYGVGIVPRWKGSLSLLDVGSLAIVLGSIASILLSAGIVCQLVNL